jgi:serine/threonine protein kinase
MQELIEMKIGPYQIQRHLARGGMANVYLARNSETEQLVAIKLVHASAEDHCERFRREMLELGRLHHHHILPALTYGEYNCWCYLVTPYIAGGTLTNLLARGPLSLEAAGKLFAQLASALQYAHEQGIVHRDIKPSNVLMRDEQYACLADFGLVKRVGFDINLTQAGYLIGTPEYMAPELEDEEASPRSDIYALGVVLYQMLTGRVPFKGSSPVNIYLKQIREQPPRPSLLNPAIPFEIEEVVLHALKKNPRERYQTAQEFNAAYQHALIQVQFKQQKVSPVLKYLLEETLPTPQVRVVQTESLHLPNILQKRIIPTPARRKHKLTFTTLATVALFLLPALIVFSENQTPSTSLAQPSIQMVRHITHPISVPTTIVSKIPTPVSTLPATPRPIVPTNNLAPASIPVSINIQPNLNNYNGGTNSKAPAKPPTKGKGKK